MNQLYPLKFHPLFKDKIWGGQKIKSQIGLDFSPLPNCGEAWVLSGVNDNETVVSDGWLAGNHLNELVEIYMDELVGEKVYEKFGEEFPLLIKLLDANDWLSIQVHPDDELAKKRHNGSGKTEMWYVLGADEKSELISGFNQKMNKELYLQHLKNKTLPDIMNFERVKAGDVFYMPSGRVHALGPGILLAEIQQTSDITYRMYDWDRVDAAGKSRDLHTEEALDAIDFNVYDDYKIKPVIKPNQTSSMVKSPYFVVNQLYLNKPLPKDYTELDSFVIYLCVEGMTHIDSSSGKTKLKTGECLLLPASTKRVAILPQPETRILEIFTA
ncbi:MAG: class I mannose-6-phosphate isomerase [Bacteroidales bacterium]|nr:class I mannose-6-phosphate isomerase [Bacteroidales bacterium]